MTAFDYIKATAVIVAVSYAYLRIFDAWDNRCVAACIRRIGISACPRCGQVIGADVAATAKPMMIKFGTESRKKLRSQRHPSQLRTVVCPHCSKELQYRMDGSVFYSDHDDWEVYEPNDNRHA